MALTTTFMMMRKRRWKRRRRRKKKKKRNTMTPRKNNSVTLKHCYLRFSHHQNNRHWQQTGKALWQLPVHYDRRGCKLNQSLKFPIFIIIIMGFSQIVWLFSDWRKHRPCLGWFYFASKNSLMKSTENRRDGGWKRVGVWGWGGEEEG